MNAAHLTLLESVADVLAWLAGRGVKALTVDSRAVRHLAEGPTEGSVAFVAWPGAARDGRTFVAQALGDGAAACLVEADGVHAFGFNDDRIAAVPQLKARLADIADAFYGHPSAQLAVVAVTGTNGKTSTSWWTAQALTHLGRRCGVVGTLGVGEPDAARVQHTGLTTPDPVTLHATFKAFVDSGYAAAAIEASSIGIDEQRLNATRIKVAQFTNFTQDHLDYHGDMDAYWRAKQALFEWRGLQAAVINVDDDRGEALVALSRERGLSVWAYGLTGPARLEAADIAPRDKGMTITLVERDEAGATEVGRTVLDLQLIGDFNVSNVLAVVGALRALGVPLADAAAACRALSAVPGRMEQVTPAEASAGPVPLVVVDYAHTPDALQQALRALRPLTRARGGRLWCVFGCGGNRDPIKRPLMGAMADQHADELVLTSDNPRDETPCYILSQILAGVARRDGVAVLENRHEAIAHAISQSDARDVVLIAGKGHETTQEVAGVKHPFSDVDEALAALRRRSLP